MAVSSVARLAVAKMLEQSCIVVADTFDAANPEVPEVPAGPSVKVTLRVSPRIARDMATRARATGLSHGAYVSALIDAAPVAVDHRETVRALAASTDRLASVAADLNGFARLLRRGTSPSADHVDDAVSALVREVRTHLRVAARLVTDLKPIAASLRDAGYGTPDSGSTS